MGAAPNDLDRLAALPGAELEIRDFAPCRCREPIRAIRFRIKHELRSGDEVGDQVAGSRPDAEAVPGKAGCLRRPIST
jgi:hypothetical protein